MNTLEKTMTVDQPEFQKDAELEKNIKNDDEIPDFSKKKCTWLWAWCIGPLIKLCLWSFQNYMALKTAFGYINASQQSLNITVLHAVEWASGWRGR